MTTVVITPRGDPIELLKTRLGWTDEYLTEINNRAHERLHNVEKMAQVLKQLYETDSHLVIATDFDMDGIATSVVAYGALCEMGFNVSLFCPSTQSYGLEKDEIDRLFEQYPDCKAVITGDVGITAFEAVDRIKEHGAQCLITDHHMPENEKLPNADVIVDPCQDDDSYKLKAICGAYVMWQVMYEINLVLGGSATTALKFLKTLVSIGTVSDVMTMLYENRCMVREGLAILRGIYASRGLEHLPWNFHSSAMNSVGRALYVLVHSFMDAGKLNSISDVTETFYGMYVAPTFNSIKRLNLPIDLAYTFWFSEDVDTQKEAMQDLIEANETRKSMVNAYMDEIFSTEQPYAPYIYTVNAGGGFMGLLAAKLMDINKLPTLVVALDKDGYWAGSGRSPHWLGLRDVLEVNGITALGHNYAFGVRGDDDMPLEYVRQIIAENTAEASKHVEVVPADLEISFYDDDTPSDMVLDFGQLHRISQWLDQLAPFGPGFERPVLSCRFNPQDNKIEVIGANKDHLRVKYGNFALLGWNMANRIEEFNNAKAVTVFGQLHQNMYRDTLQLNIAGDWESQ